MKPFPNWTSAFQRIRLSPDSPDQGRDIHEESYRRPSATLSTLLCHQESAQALRPAAALHYPQPWVVATPPATTACLPPC